MVVGLNFSPHTLTPGGNSLVRGRLPDKETRVSGVPPPLVGHTTSSRPQVPWEGRSCGFSDSRLFTRSPCRPPRLLHERRSGTCFRDHGPVFLTGVDGGRVGKSNDETELKEKSQ